VTEGLLIDDIDQTIARMQALTEIGIRFSIDDFGTGYSNLAYLKKMPLYELKIDKGFMRDTPRDVNGTAIVQSILAMATHLGLRVVAEGIETAEQGDFLSTHGRPHMQGFLFHRPMPLDRVVEYLDTTRGAATTDATELEAGAVG
jgi:EAL domain-containing protein (putative c-di-GMP-specific phosphodiesterase class I)